MAEKVSASKKLGEVEAKQLINEAQTIHIAKGKKLEAFEGGEASEQVVKKMLGATGNLRAPTIKVARTVLVGFNEEVFDQVFGE